MTKRLNPHLKSATRALYRKNSLSFAVIRQVMWIALNITLLVLIKVMKGPLLESIHVTTIDFRIETILATLVSSSLLIGFFYLVSSGKLQGSCLINLAFPGKPPMYRLAVQDSIITPCLHPIFQACTQHHDTGFETDLNNQTLVASRRKDEKKLPICTQPGFLLSC